MISDFRSFEKIHEHASMPKKLIFGTNSVKRVGVEAKRFGDNALIVTDEGIERAGLVGKVMDSMKSEGLSPDIFNKVKAEPSSEDIKLIANIVRGKEYEMIIGVGGGSCLDTAKIASIMATNPGEVEQYVSVSDASIGLIKKPGLPKILIPTTSGTGSEATRGAIISIKGIKEAIFSPWLIADVAIVDPLMSMTMPPKLTAVTGFDALSQAIEAVMSVRSNVVTNALALESIRLISNSLETAYQNGSDIKARYNMAIAATIGGMAFANAGVNLGHAISYALSTEYGVTHGLGCALALPYAMKYNLESLDLDKLNLIAIAMGEDISGLEPHEATLKLIKAIIKILRSVELPLSLKELNIPKETLPKLAETLVSKYSRLLTNNPRKVSIEDAARICHKMWEGSPQDI